VESHKGKDRAAWCGDHTMTQTDGGAVMKCRGDLNGLARGKGSGELS